jgi:DnaJ-class molecular chaperone
MSNSNITINVSVQLEPCKKCGGTGKTEQCEYTPPFERFMGTCPECNGAGRKVVGIKPLNTSDSVLFY